MSKPAILKSALRTTYALSLAALPHRTELPYLLNRRGLLGAAVEVGVKAGEFSEWILERWHGRLLISVDPWGEYSTGTQSIEQSEQERLFRQTKQRLARFGGRSDVWRVTSLEAATRLQPASLDFIYIDARHEYNHVRDDIEAWWPLLRPGGIMGGHDYLDGRRPSGTFGVKRAVDEFFGAREVRVWPTRLDGKWPSWVVAAPS